MEAQQFGAGDILAMLAVVGGILFAVWKMIESVRSDVKENRRESTREHKELDAKFTARFDAIDRQNRQRLRALIDADL